MSEKIKEYAIYPGQIKINNEIFFGLDYKLTDFYNELVEENKQLESQLQQKENIIKEVGEWAKKCSCQFTNDDGELVVSEISFNIQARPCDLFKILDKENK